MENTSSNISESIPIPTNILERPSIDTTSFFDTIKNVNIFVWILIIVILAFFGFNIFAYLAEGTQDITDIFRPIINTIYELFLYITGTTINVGAEGAKDVINVTADVLDTGLTTIQQIVPSPKNAQSSIQSEQLNEGTKMNKSMNSLNQTINNKQTKNTEYEPVEASSSVSGKAGWCYIGEEKGFRTCSQVGVNDQCMSGDIFPSQEICINPNLRP